MGWPPEGRGEARGHRMGDKECWGEGAGSKSGPIQFSHNPCSVPAAPGTCSLHLQDAQEESQLRPRALKEGPRRRRARLSAKPAPEEVEEARSREAAGKHKSSDTKAQTKGREEQRGNRLRWLTKKLKICLQKTGKLKIGDPASDEAEEDEAKSD